MPGAAFLRGDRVELRTVEHEDVAFLQRARNDPAIRQGLLFTTPKNRDVVESFVDEVVGDDDNGSQNFLVCRPNDPDEPMGGAALFDVGRDHGTLAYWLAPEYHGEGYASEAVSLVLDHSFGTLGLHHVVAWTIEGNDASQRLLGRLGFEQEGRYRGHIWWNGDYRDTVHFGLLRDEWL
ncbi:GNAT family N-acetyltransferase [Haloarchaeobius sp. DFWS5]|uniref:GNAT family N-acetyltransferase n=1 Tax=Haloarchaeobius sp. DFWS5 TaxID=3446114 RepID=UPI003EBA6153